MGKTFSTLICSNSILETFSPYTMIKWPLSKKRTLFPEGPFSLRQTSLAPRNRAPAIPAGPFHRGFDESRILSRLYCSINFCSFSTYIVLIAPNKFPQYFNPISGWVCRYSFTWLFFFKASWFTCLSWGSFPAS